MQIAFSKYHALGNDYIVINPKDLPVPLTDAQVKIYGNTAVITFAITWHGNFRGNDISGPQRMTDVWVKSNGHWQCVASQATRIRSP